MAGDAAQVDKSIRIKGFAAGVASGVTKLAIGQPFDIIKVRLQCSPPGVYKGALDCLLKTLRLEGPRALYKGASAPLFGWGLSDSVLLGSLHNYRVWLARLESNGQSYTSSARAQTKQEQEELGIKSLSVFGHGVAGLLAGCTVCTVITPIEMIKARLQMQTHSTTKEFTGPIDVIQKVYRQNGPFGLYRGFGATLLFRSNFGFMFATYEVLMRQFRAMPNMSTGTSNFLAGGLSSFVFWTFAFPADAVKNRLMSDSLYQPRYNGVRQAARAIWSEGGIRAVFRGFTPCILRSFPTNASALFVYETTMRFMDAEQVA
ncbi:uncharacterized protein L969DRAFT_76229 [Mixia osmundae IAM 14324]|uniref:Mitochondrial carrier n=1 Tax=Mixia osmundae (strain CBS 9802 / IAM 14324 / JCM 22182 / KY 12970) TaxID=764103 RepID=G7DZ31_MIXOS|nr:uncharacterized protein L969DRAFT_76229 [Mixia osmundae IAM 14324]KEI38242.1 hypothetical protein L969DRAFT_76229 [Mixia osmundae IAM 14324]GAA95841.1 hypothetical protein E5Q_02498 [Mixia osmundae IAM 14324]